MPGTTDPRRQPTQDDEEPTFRPLISERLCAIVRFTDCTMIMKKNGLQIAVDGQLAAPFGARSEFRCLPCHCIDRVLCLIGPDQIAAQPLRPGVV